MADGLERAYASGEIKPCQMAHDDLPFDLLDAHVAESGPRARRLMNLMRERGWDGWSVAVPGRARADRLLAALADREIASVPGALGP
jgi:hypothetical protein